MRAYVGNVKWRGFRLDTGNYSWGSEAVTRKTRIPDVVYNASNSELVRTQTLVKLFRLMQHHSNSGTFSIMEWILDGRRRPQQLLRRTRKVMLRARRRRRPTMSAGS